MMRRSESGAEFGTRDVQEELKGMAGRIKGMRAQLLQAAVGPAAHGALERMRPQPVQGGCDASTLG